MSEIVKDQGRDAVLLVGGGSLCAASVPLLLAAGLVPAGVIHGPRCDFVAEAGVPPLGRDADLARLRREFSRAVVTAPHKQTAKLRRLLHDALRELGFALVSAVHPDVRMERDVLVGAGSLIFGGVAPAWAVCCGPGPAWRQAAVWGIMSIWEKTRTWVRASWWKKGPIWDVTCAWRRAYGWKKIFLCRTVSTSHPGPCRYTVRKGDRTAAYNLPIFKKNFMKSYFLSTTGKHVYAVFSWPKTVRIFRHPR